jgi:hypothetical protein
MAAKSPARGVETAGVVGVHGTLPRLSSARQHWNHPTGSWEVTCGRYRETIVIDALSTGLLKLIRRFTIARSAFREQIQRLPRGG